MADFAQHPLVSSEWLAANLTAPDLRVVDGSYYLPHEGLDPRAEHALHHIPGALFFDIDDIADSESTLPHMLPSPVKFSSKVRRLGLGDGLRIVVYDQRGLFSAPRVWWTFRHFGHKEVAVLDGGLPKWMAEGRPVDEGEARAGERHFTPRVDSFLLRDRGQLMANLKSRREQVLDARSRGRFEGSEPEPREGLRGGRIPGSLCLPYGTLIDAETQTLKPEAELRAAFDAAGLDMKKPVVTTCGSGITAATLALALHILGHREVSVYDGSWSEWGLPGDTPVETGPVETGPPAAGGA